MALDTLISGAFGMLSDFVNMSIADSTNKSNEKNVAATNQANKEITESTNATNLKITQETNASNERIMQETNAFNAAQADLAYQRSTSAAKLGELISAGLSPEQARQIIASQGITGSPSAASGTAIPAQSATMQAPQYESFQKQPYFLQNGLEDFGRGIGSFAQSFVDAAKDPTGGNFGQLTCMQEFAKASNIIDEVDSKALSSNYEFFKWMKSQPSDSNWGKLISTPSFQKMWNNPISRKSFMFNMNQWFGQSASTSFDLERKELDNALIAAQKHATDIDTKLTNAQIFKTVADTSLTEAQTNLTHEHISGAIINNAREGILLDRDQQLKSLITETQKTKFALELADAELQSELIKNPKYRDAYFTSTIGNLAAATAEFEYVKWRYQTTLNGTQAIDPDTFAVFTLLEDLGFSHTQTYEDMLKAVVKDSNLATYLMGKGWNGFPTLLPDGAVDGYSMYKSSLEQWSKDMEQMRFNALRPFLKRENIQFGVSSATNLLGVAVKAVK